MKETNDTVAARIADLRSLLKRLEEVGPVVPPGVAVSLLGVSRTHYGRLKEDGKLRIEPICGADFVVLRSVLSYEESRFLRRQRRK